MTDKITETIDLSLELEAIKKEFGSRYYLNQKAINKAAALWGAPCNECGVFSNYVTEDIIRLNRHEAEIHFAETTKGYWLIGISASTPMSGFGYAPSIWDTLAFKSYHDARLAGISIVHDFFSRTAANASRSQIEEIKKVLALLNTEKTPQLNLF